MRLTKFHQTTLISLIMKVSTKFIQQYIFNLITRHIGH